MIGNLTLEEARSRLREIAANLDDRAMFVEAQELRDIAARLGIKMHNNRKGGGQKPRRLFMIKDSNRYVSR